MKRNLHLSVYASALTVGMLLSTAACTTTQTAQTAPAPTGATTAQDFSKGFVGKVASGFTLPDANGKPVNLDTVLGKKPVILVFYRGVW